MPTAADDEARAAKREEVAQRTEQALNNFTKWVGDAFAGVLTIVVMVVGLVLACLYIGALFSSPVVTLLATITVILVLLLLSAGSTSG